MSTWVAGTQDPSNRKEQTNNFEFEVDAPYDEEAEPDLDSCMFHELYPPSTI